MDRFRNIVVGLDLAGGDRLVTSAADLSPAGRRALEDAVAVARRSSGAVHLLAALDVEPLAEDLIRRDEAAGRPSLLGRARATLEALAAGPRSSGIAVTCAVAFGNPRRVLLNDVASARRDLVVVGTRERGGVARNLLGSTSLRLLRKCPVAVWVARHHPHPGVRVVLAPVDAGDMGPKVIGTAAALAAAHGAELHLLHALDPSSERALRAGGVTDAVVEDYRKGRRASAEELVRGLLRGLPPGSPVARSALVEGDPAEAILETATKIGADAVVLGTVSHGAVAGVLMGSVAEKVLPLLPTSLLVVKPDGA